MDRRGEVEGEIRDRVYAVSSPAGAGDPTYVEGLRTALPAAFDYAIEGLEGDAEAAVPVALLVQARLAARCGVSLDTVLRRYFAGYTLLIDFLMLEAQDGGFGGDVVRQLVQTQATLFDRLVAAITDEHSREWKRQPGSSEERRLERVEAVLDGGPADGGLFEYDFNLVHLGVIVSGEDAADLVRDLALALDCRLLVVRPDDRTAWAWLGARSEADLARLEHTVAERSLAQLLALGEPATGLSGWRLTHHQAKASLMIAMPYRRRVVRYANVAILASIAGDELLSASLRKLFLEPLADGRDGGATLRQTIRAYFTAELNVSSAAAALGVSRQTVVNRLRAVEERLGRPLNSCAVELEAALRLEEFDEVQGDLADQAAAGASPLQPVKPIRVRLGTLPNPAASQV